MKGMSKPLAMFMKIMEIVFVVIALIAVFFSITQYTTIQTTVLGTKEADNVMQAVLSAPCLTVTAADDYAVRGLFDESKLSGNANPSCIDYNGRIKIAFNGGISKEIGYADVDPLKNVTYPAAVKLNSGKVKPVMVRVMVD